jgi:hypothetical protein
MVAMATQWWPRQRQHNGGHDGGNGNSVGGMIAMRGVGHRQQSAHQGVEWSSGGGGQSNRNKKQANKTASVFCQKNKKQNKKTIHSKAKGTSTGISTVNFYKQNAKTRNILSTATCNQTEQLQAKEENAYRKTSDQKHINYYFYSTLIYPKLHTI